MVKIVSPRINDSYFSILSLSYSLDFLCLSHHVSMVSRTGESKESRLLAGLFWLSSQPS